MTESEGVSVPPGPSWGCARSLSFCHVGSPEYDRELGRGNTSWARGLQCLCKAKTLSHQFLSFMVSWLCVSGGELGGAFVGGLKDWSLLRSLTGTEIRIVIICLCGSEWESLGLESHKFVTELNCASAGQPWVSHFYSLHWRYQSNYFCGLLNREVWSPSWD